MANTPMQSPVSRRNVLTAGALMMGLGMASAAMPAPAFAADGGGPGTGRSGRSTGCKPRFTVPRAPRTST